MHATAEIPPTGHGQSVSSLKQKPLDLLSHKFCYLLRTYDRDNIRIETNPSKDGILIINAY